MLQTLKYISTHPFNQGSRLPAILRFAKWQLNCLLNPFPVLFSFTKFSKLLVKKGMTGATGNIYCGLVEFEDMGFLLHFLRPEDSFFDIGANIGAYTVLASAEIGAKTLSVEPVPSTFEWLCDNVSVNRIEQKVKVLNLGIGSQQGIIQFTKSLDTVNHVAIEGDKDTIDVQIRSLDGLEFPTPILMKIDVEGFETEVLNGASKLLANSALKAIIIELNGSGSRYGFDDSVIHKKLLFYGFQPCTYNPKTREIISLPTYGKFNTIYLRDMAFAQDRVKTARKVEVQGKSF